MANTLLSTATGLFSATTTFNICDPTSELDSEAAAQVVGTTVLDSSSFVPANKAVSGVAVKLQAHTATATGTLTISFRNSTSPGTRDFSVTINTSDLPVIGTGVPIGWMVFQAASPVTPNGTDSYVIRAVKSAVGDTVNLYASSGNNWSRQVIYSGTGAGLSAAPGAGDKIIVCGNLTGAGTGNNVVVTYDNTASTIWGASAAAFAISVGQRGTLRQQLSASTAYLLNYLGRFQVAGGGTWDCNSSSLPSTSSLIVTAQNAANVDCGLEIGALGVVTFTGATKTTLQTKLTSGNGGLCSTNGTAVTGLEGQAFTGLTGTININGSPFTISSVTDATHLTLTGSAGVQTTVPWNHPGTATVANVGAATGWNNGDLLCFASTTRTPGDCESKVISSSASLAVTLTVALANYHSADTSPNDIRAEVGNLTRNIVIQGNTSSLGSYININATASVTLRYVEFTKLGSATTNKRGIDVATITGLFDMQFCSIHDCTVASSIGVNISGAASNNVTVSNNVTYNVANIHINIANATSNVLMFDSNLLVRNTDNVQIITSADVGATFTNNIAVGAVNNGIAISEANQIGTFSGNVAHSGTLVGISLGFLRGIGSIGSNTSWRNTGGGVQFTGLLGSQTFAAWTTFGNSGQSLNWLGAAGRVTLQSWDMRAGVNLTTVGGILLNSANYLAMLLESCVFGGGGQTHSTGDITVTTIGNYNVVALNSTFNSTTIVANQSNMQPYSYIASLCHNTTAGRHLAYMGEALLASDAVIYDTSPSLRITPIASASPALRPAESSVPGQGFPVYVANGNAAVVSVKVRKSVVGDGTAYNGNAPRLWVRRNVAAGIAADTLLATDGGTGSASTTWGSGGTAEILTAILPTITGDCRLDLYVDSGVGVASPTGWFNIDTWVVLSGGYAGTYGTELIWFNGFPEGGMAGGVIVIED